MTICVTEWYRLLLTIVLSSDMSSCTAEVWHGYLTVSFLDCILLNEVWNVLWNFVLLFYMRTIQYSFESPGDSDHCRKSKVRQSHIQYSLTRYWSIQWNRQHSEVPRDPVRINRATLSYFWKTKRNLLLKVKSGKQKINILNNSKVGYSIL